MLNFFIYLFTLIIVTWAVDSINLSPIFKKNRPYQARTIYVIIILSLTYLSASFIINFISSIN